MAFHFQNVLASCWMELIRRRDCSSFFIFRLKTSAICEKHSWTDCFMCNLQQRSGDPLSSQPLNYTLMTAAGKNLPFKMSCLELKQLKFLLLPALVARFCWPWPNVSNPLPAVFGKEWGVYGSECYQFKGRSLSRGCSLLFDGAA